MRDCLLMVFANKQDLPGGELWFWCMDMGISIRSREKNDRRLFRLDRRAGLLDMKGKQRV